MNNQSLFLPQIEGLRAFAVIAVILYHFSKMLLPNGYLGVDIFFVISGYVISKSLLNYSSNHFSQFIGIFYTKRIKRLLPALLFCVLLTSFSLCLFISNTEMSLKTAMAAIFGVSNIYLFNYSMDYFAPAIDYNFFTQTWSLGVEEQFYFIFPMLTWFLGIRKKDNFIPLIRTILVLSLSSLILFIYLSQKDPMAAYFLMPSRFWELGAGCLLYLISIDENYPLAKILGFIKAKINPNLIFCLLCISLFIPAKTPAYITILLISLLIISLKPGNLSYSLLTKPLALYVGTLSYSLYLWHWPILSLGRWLSLNEGYWILLEVVLIIALSLFSYHCIETPLRKRKWSSINLKAISYGLTASVFSFFICFALIKGTRIQHFMPLKDSGFSYKEYCVLRANEKLKDHAFDLCTIKPTTAKQTIWALGDSHAGHLQGLLYALNEKLGLGIHLTEAPGQLFPAETLFDSQKIMWKQIKNNLHQGDIVLISRLFLDRDSKQKMNTIDDWLKKQVLPLSEELAKKGVNLVIVGPLPMFNFKDIKRCTDNNCDIERQFISAEITSIYKMINQDIKGKKNLYLFNPFDVFCPKSSKKCSPMKEGQIAFRDSDHLSYQGASLLKDNFIGFLSQHALLATNNLP
ncbi:MAG: acyltransferase [Proteobacteria bacterium]|nr:acyltransferase [Pseudomonadota bacterium]